MTWLKSYCRFLFLHPLERANLRRAKADGKEVLPLGTADEQFGLIGNISPEAQEASP
jgi:hypothetical protein